MTLIRRTTPFESLMTLRFGDGKHEIGPAIDLCTTWVAVIGEVALPRIRPEDVDITMAGDLVTIAGRFEEPKETVEPGYLYKELYRGAFSRTFTILTMVKFDEAKATFKDGLLTLRLPKAEVVKPKHLKVEVK